MPGADSRAALGAAFLVACAATVLPIFAVEHPPLVDLPQHEALVSILRLWNEPACGFPAIYEIDRFSPNWLGYLLAWMLSFAFGIGGAVKLLLALALTAAPLLTARLLQLAGGDPAWALLLFPLGYGCATVWGFFGFVLAMPLVLGTLLGAIRFLRAPTLSRGAALAATFLLLFFTHFLAFASGLLIVGAMLAAGESGTSALRLARKSWLVRLAPLVPSALVASAWVVDLRHRAGVAAEGSRFGWSLDRLTALPRQLTGIPQDRLALLAITALFAVLVATGARPSRDFRRWLPAALAGAVVLLGPAKIVGTALMPERFAMLLAPALLYALDRRAARWRGTLVAACAVSLLLLSGTLWRFRTIDGEGAGLEELLQEAPDGERLLYLPFDRASSVSWEPVFAYSGSRYAVDRCGVAERSFASYNHYPIRFRADVATGAPPLPAFVEFAPHRFRWDRDGGERFGLLLVRSQAEPPLERITRGAVRLELLGRSGAWWLFRNPAPRG